MLANHAKKQADMTASCLRASLKEVWEFGVIGIDTDDKEVITFITSNWQVPACRFHDEETNVKLHWQDVGTPGASRAANMGLPEITLKPDLHDDQSPIFTCLSQLPSARPVGYEISRQVTEQDPAISGPRLKRPVSSSSVHAHSFAEIEESVVLPEVVIGVQCRL